MDAQGFIQDDLFYPREISIISHTVKMTILVEPELNYSEMNVKDRVTNMYISNNILGMPMRGHKEKKSHNLSTDALEQIRNLYDMVRKEDEKYLGIRNDQLAHILKIINIPFIDLKRYDCPSYKALAQRYRGIHCNFHEREVPDRRMLRCAEKKCELLWKWMVSYLTH